jgi:HAD superfamily hydrolase (TIGR01549 family)
LESTILKINDYKVLIFDCDGVIFDTNKLKVLAFHKVLDNYDKSYIDQFLSYFSKNFGKSRYIHVRHFIENILKIPFDDRLYNQILQDYSNECQLLYKKAEICFGIIDLLTISENHIKYVASGSDQTELREVFIRRDLDHYFESIFGSPISKNDLVKDICSNHPNDKILMIGDAKADFIAAKLSEIDFLYVSRYSMDNKNMKKLRRTEEFTTVIDLSEIIESFDDSKSI